MPTKRFNSTDRDCDLVGNDAAFRCPECGQVFLVSGTVHFGPDGERGVRACPNCGKSTAHYSDGVAAIEWPDRNR